MTIKLENIASDLPLPALSSLFLREHKVHTVIDVLHSTSGFDTHPLFSLLPTIDDTWRLHLFDWLCVLKTKRLAILQGLELVLKLVVLQLLNFLLMLKIGEKVMKIVNRVYF